MLARPPSGERALLVHVGVGRTPDPADVDEFQELARTAGVQMVSSVSATRKAPDPRLFLGSGKAEAAREAAARHSADVVLVDQELSPRQERNLERLLECRVLDRSALILDIFAQRARSHEGKLQVELAQLQHLSTRLVRGWTHLERQKGGIGLRGPGETQLETDRRLVADRIRTITGRLEHVSRRRNQGRESRRRAEVQTLSLVGYTNAGKSTLFNRLTASGVYAADQLFATLDPTLRRLSLPQRGTVILADTVGFIRNLPHELIAAFRSTLQETTEAALILHVIDAASPSRAEHKLQVEKVLTQIGAGNVPRIEVYNKADLLDDARTHVPQMDEAGRVQRLWVSARTGAGVDALLAAVAERVASESLSGWVRLSPTQARARARLFALGAVVAERVVEDGVCLLQVQASRRDLERLAEAEGFGTEWLRECA